MSPQRAAGALQGEHVHHTIGVETFPGSLRKRGEAAGDMKAGMRRAMSTRSPDSGTELGASLGDQA
jgi:hypothetical protein